MLPPGDSASEIVTPHKIALLVLVKNYADISDGRYDLHARIAWLDDELISKRRLNRSLLTWIQQPDGTLKNILHVLSSCSRILHSTLRNSLQTLCDSEDPQLLEDFFQDLSSLIADPTEDNLLQRGGILGLFCRRMVLYYEKLSFFQLQPLHDNLTKYCSSLLSRRPPRNKESFRRESTDNDDTHVADDNKSDSFDEMELESQSELDSKSSEESGLGIVLKPSDLKTNQKNEDMEASEVFTSRQADFFFAQQAALITDKETMAMSPAKLQNKISQILKNNPKLTEAHYLSYLNCLRVREFCGSIDCLLVYFNRQTKISGMNTQSNTAVSDGASQICRYAALNLALLHYRFGHKKAALAAVKEAVNLSQLSADTQCLQHAMSLMSQIDPANVNLSLLEHQVKPAKQMNLIRLASNAIQRNTNKEALQGKRPSQVFMQLIASEALARSRAVESLSATNYVHKGALWRMYGKRQMAAIYCQLALTYQGSSRRGPNLFPWQPNTADIALSLCHLVELLHETGEIAESNEILRHVKQRFPKQMEHSEIWQITELRLRHKMALRNCKLTEAVQAEQEILTFDKQESEFRKAERLFVSGDNIKSHSILQQLLKNASPDEGDLAPLGHMRQCTPELQCKIFLLLGRVLFTENCDNSSSLNYLLKALSTATKHFLHSLVIEAKMLIAQSQLYSAMPHHSLNILDSCIHECLTNGNLMDLSRLKLIQAKCLLSRKKCSLEDVENCIDLISRAKHGFELLQDLHLQKDATYFLARLYHEKSKIVTEDPSSSSESPSEIISVRNKFSSEFKNLDSLTFSSHPSLLV